MFQSFTVKNFRCFRDLTLEPLERFNLIAGKNNTGKTTLLEAIHLFCNPNDCQLPFAINKDRGIEEPEKDFCAVADWLFHDHSTNRKIIDFSGQDEHGIERAIKVSLTDGLSAAETLTERERAEIATHSPFFLTLAPYLVIGFREASEEWVHSIAAPHHVISGGRAASLPARAAKAIPSRFLTVSASTVAHDVENFNSLETAKRQGEILPALRILEPRLERLFLVLFAGIPVIHGDIGLPTLVPLPLMGEGLRRLLSIVLAIANAAGGVVLIDEIENGLHHSVLVRVWQAIAEAARRANVQVFATSHSYECIQAAQQAFAAGEIGGLRLFRLDWIDNEIRVAFYNQEILNFAIEMTHEVR